jgi:hypothetical protein
VHCSTAAHIVQFVNREIIGAAGQLARRIIKTVAGQYETTTDASNPVWNTDSAAKPTPYYEAAGAHHVEAGSLTVYDQPTVGPGVGETWRANFRSYVICDKKVVREVTWTRSQTSGESPKYQVSVTYADRLPAWANELLKAQGYHPAL